MVLCEFKFHLNSSWSLYAIIFSILLFYFLIRLSLSPHVYHSSTPAKQFFFNNSPARLNNSDQVLYPQFRSEGGKEIFWQNLSLHCTQENSVFFLCLNTIVSKWSICYNSLFTCRGLAAPFIGRTIGKELRDGQEI